MGFDDEQFEHGSISLVMPAKELILQAKQFNMHASSVCLQLGFYTLNEDLLYPFHFADQVMESPTAITVGTLDDDGYRFIGEGTGLRDLIIAPMFIYFPYDFTT